MMCSRTVLLVSSVDSYACCIDALSYRMHIRIYIHVVVQTFRAKISNIHSGSGLGQLENNIRQ